MKVVWIILLIIIAYPIYLGVSRMTVEERYAHAAKKHLEQKYEEEFFVEQQAQDPRDKLLPHVTFPPTSYFYAYPLSDPDYVFRVYITKSEFSYKISEITDTYYFKFLRIKMQDYVHEQFKEVIGDEMKVNVRIDESIGAPKTLDHNSTLDDFFETNIDENEYSPDVRVAIFFPEYGDENEGNIIQQSHQFSLNMFNNKVRGYVVVNYVKDRNKYNLIDVSRDYNVRLDEDALNGTLGNDEVLQFWEEGNDELFLSIYFLRFRNAIAIEGAEDNE